MNFFHILTDAVGAGKRGKGGLKKGTLLGNPSLNIANQKTAVVDKDLGLTNREESVTAREEITHSREETADKRDDVAQVREQAVHVRETISLSRERIIQDAVPMKAELDNNIVRLREANEHLVISSVLAQTMMEEAEKAKDEMGHMAHHDFLTDLPNRIMLMERMEQAIAGARRHGAKLAVLFLDLDRFKTINDSLGHTVGDILLQAVARRLVTSVRSTDTVSRQGGDEFVVLLSEVQGEKAVSSLAKKISKAVAAPYMLADQALHIGVSIGISMYPDDAKDAEILLRHADVAMYHAKRSGHESPLFFTEEMNARAVERQQIESDLYCALERNEFELYYQPQVELQSGAVIGVEALIRWHHPVRGLLLPGLFVPFAEACGAIIPIGRWVLREACRQTQAWFNAGLASQVVAVNISAREFERDDFLENVRAVLQETGLAPHNLELELTEGVLMKSAQSTMTVLQELKSLGIKIAIDDFGTGYSSLSYLSSHAKFTVNALP